MPGDSWIRNDSDVGNIRGHAHACTPCGEPRRFHWRQAHTEALQLARSHDLHWSSEMGGYVCIPKQGNCRPAPPAAVQLQRPDQQSAWLDQQQQQQQESASSATAAATAAATAQQLPLLKLPPVLCGADHLPQRRLHDIIGGKAAPGVQLIVLLSADSAALAVCRAGTIVRHKTMTGRQRLHLACCRVGVHCA